MNASRPSLHGTLDAADPTREIAADAALPNLGASAIRSPGLPGRALERGLGLGFGVWGSGFIVRGLWFGFRVQTAIVSLLPPPSGRAW